jgi:AraC-like DNA-binding protein
MSDSYTPAPTGEPASVRSVDENHSGAGGNFGVRPALGDLVGSLPLLEQETVQLGSGKPAFAARQVLSRDLVMFQSKVSPRLVGNVVPDPAWMVFMLPLGWRGEYRFNGVVARPLDVFMAGDPCGYTTVGEARNTLAIGVRRARLEHDTRALAGDAEVRPLHDRRLVLARAQSTTLRRWALAAMNSALNQPLGEGRFILPRTVEGDFISLLSAVVLSQPAKCPSRDPGRLLPGQVVRAAVRAHDAQRGHSVSLAQLCEASGVGQTWLSKFFRDIYGISPMAYLRARRLSMARSLLLDQSNPPSSVKDVALSLGFMNLGRFAADYRARFDEKPSVSLLRTTRNESLDA